MVSCLGCRIGRVGEGWTLKLSDGDDESDGLQTRAWR